MFINLYNNTSPPNYVNKSITEVISLEGTLREPTSIIDPIVIVERNTPMGFNYVHIPIFNRYYFVTGISSESNGLVAIAMHVDVLMTYKEQIANMNAIIKRQENQYNLYLDDGIFKAYQNTKHKIIKFPYGFNNFSYVLALAGNGEQS